MKFKGPLIVASTTLILVQFMLNTPTDAAKPKSSAPCDPSLLSLNDGYFKVHQEKETEFWKSYMGHASYVKGSFEAAEIRYKNYVSDPDHLTQVTEALKRPNLSDSDRVGLEGWKRFYEINAIADPKVREFKAKMIEFEGKVLEQIATFKLSYRDPETKTKVNSNLTNMGLILGSSPDEKTRKSVIESFYEKERYILEKTDYLKLIKMRNEFARMRGFTDYYEMKVKQNEGMTKAQLFQYLDDLKAKSMKPAKERFDQILAQHGKSLKEAWNFKFMTKGDLEKKIDPYFPFSKAMAVWLRFMQNLGVRYNVATVQVDLVNREKKYQNGFMHGPGPAFIDKGTFRPARINFTANAIPGAIGSGFKALTTFAHEGGHAADFAGIFMPSPVFSQEYAPTSVAKSETQSMFLDSLISTPHWLARYAKTQKGEPMPEALILEFVQQHAQTRALEIRSMMAVPYTEKLMYEAKDSELTPDFLIKGARAIEKELTFLNGSQRPTFVIPHLYPDESSAYYHGYVMAEGGLAQTDDHFNKNYGYVVDNPIVGEQMAEKYWKPGNSKTFFQVIEQMTGRPFSADSLVASISKTDEEVAAWVKAGIEWEKKTHAAFEKTLKNPIDLELNLSVVHGDELIATTNSGQSYEKVAEVFEKWIKRLEKEAAK